VGVSAAGGQGTRYSSFKVLESVYDKPPLLHLVSQLQLAGVRRIMIVCSARNVHETRNTVDDWIGDPAACGLELSFCTTPSSNGPAGVFLIPAVREFVKGRPVALMLDGIAFGGSFDRAVAAGGRTTEGCAVVAARVVD